MNNVVTVKQELSTDVKTLTTEILMLKKQTAENIFGIGRRLIEVKEQLPRGEWLSWLKSEVEFTRQTATRFMRVAREFPNGTSVLHLPVNKLYALLDVPADEREEFMEEMPIEDMKISELEQAIKDRKALEEKVRELTENPVEVEVEVEPPDYRSLKRQIETLQDEHEMGLKEIGRLENEKKLLDRKVKLNEKEVEEYGNLKKEIENLKGKKSQLSRQLQSTTELSGLVVKIENMLQKELAPVRYSRAVDELRDDRVIMENLHDIVSRVQEWCDEMNKVLIDSNYIECEVISNE